VLSRAWALKQRAWEKVEAARKGNRPLTGTVTGQVKGGLVVDVGTRAFLPASHVDLHHVDDLAPLVGQSIEALVVEADRANDKVVLSRRNLLRQAERAKAAQFAATLEPGQVHRGRVALLTDFGAFVDIAGVRGLVHLSELTWGRVERAADVVSVGSEVDVKVLAIKPGKKVSLSIRALTTDPLASIHEGDIVQGVVTRLADFGAFVRVGDGAEGLVHVTELAEYRVHAPEEVVAPGDEVWVKVLRIDRKRRRVDLSVNQALLG
jgi:ribosomal protein S1